MVAGGVGANRRLREKLSARAAKSGYRVYYPDLEFCTDNGAMIAFAGALRLERGMANANAEQLAFTVKPRWDLSELEPPS